ncbi:MAG TPA: D-glucuronyl C5-epimerase family protein [Candidatus Dormibacteraeota bacterium]|nr:D-glucuronyl C5-epimerase family protein [Candidatus Dormibacteraeota bacterium]
MPHVRPANVLASGPMRKGRQAVRLVDALPPNRLRQLALGFPLDWSHRRYWRAPSSVPYRGAYYVEWFADSGTYGEDWDGKPRDDEGVLLTNGVVPTYHPIRIAQFALHCYGRWFERGDRVARESFLAQARWLQHNQRRIGLVGGCYPFPFPWPKYRAPSGWLSAMAQGEAISVLLRAHGLAPGAGFDAAARAAARPFDSAIERGGVVFKDGQDVFLEECAVLPAPHILNGCIFALWGIWELEQFDPQSRRRELIDAVLQTILRWIGAFDTRWWSRYSLQRSAGGRDHLATLKYHAFHIAQLRVLAEMTGDARFSRIAERWEAYISHIASRARVLLETALSLPERFGAG